MPYANDYFADLLEDLDVGIVLEDVASFCGFFLGVESDSLLQFQTKTAFVFSRIFIVVIFGVDAVVPSFVIAGGDVVSVRSEWNQIE